MHLPPHLDYPLNDGFGIVIVTVCVRGDATILLLRGGDVRAERVWQFPVKAGDVYCLSADARNLCDHGVLVPLPSTRARARAAAEGKKGKGGRESMNLRFGLHGSGPQDPFPAHDEVLRQFDDDFVDEFKRRRADQL
uniref:Alpha-ketoglutarate-dependent dioxygenase AlkB-like domain-containing protein n=1 Tax=Octactis speculum TaxID=3111310 RepID=A0A7S2AXK9_9STRA|mmetsp:Transcript_17114/g.23010  ORF Transcript_17114/g.23010 Transcript_17114/m.23010 type:complete len:137 (+) Transcript_17114:308-718(+)